MTKNTGFLERATLIPDTEYAERRVNLMDKLPDGSVAIVRGASVQQMTTDIPYRFRQDSQMRYLCGYDEPQSMLIMARSSDGVPRTVLLVPKRDPQKEQWDGARQSDDDIVSEYLIDLVGSFDDMGKILPEILTKTQNVYYDKQSWMPEDNFHKLVLKIVTDCDKVVAGGTNRIVDELRVIKSKAEQQVIAKACQVSSNAFIDAMKASAEEQRCKSSSEVSEHFLDAVLEFGVRKRGASSLSFPPVVAGGERACTIHYISNDQPIRDGAMVLVDAGAELYGYCGDISRTWPLNGKFSRPQKDLYNAILRVQQRCIQHCRCDLDDPLSLQKLHMLSAKWLGQELADLGIISRNTSDIVFNQNVRKYYPHSIGHYLGMDVHDTRTKSTGANFAPGMVVTIEPGLYLPLDDLDVPEQYRGIGIRIEDDILITDGDPVNLTSDCPKQVDEIEELMIGGK